MVFNNLVTLLISLGMIVSVGIWGYIITRKYKVPFGEAVVTDLTVHNESYLVAIIIFVTIASSIMAAVVHSPDVLEQPLFARMMIHTGIGVIGITSVLSLFHEVRRIFEKNLPGKYMFWRFMAVTLLVVMSIGAPYGNLVLMAKNVGQSTLFDLWYYSIKPWSDREVIEQSMVALGYDKNSDPWSLLQASVCSEIVLVALHLGILILEGIRNVSSPARTSFIDSREAKFEVSKEEKKKEEKKEDKKPEASKEGNNKDESEDKNETPDDIFSFILKRFNYRGRKYEESLKKLIAEYEKLSPDETKVKFLVELTKEKTIAVNIDKGNSSVSKDDNKKAIIRLLAGSPKSTDNPGLGFTLSPQ